MDPAILIKKEQPLHVLNTQKSPTLNIINKNPTPSPKNDYHITADEYQRYGSTREHIYNITDTYIGSDEQMSRMERVLNLDTLTFQEETINVPEGVERIFVEISSNAGDNVARSLRNGVDPGEASDEEFSRVMSNLKTPIQLSRIIM